MGVDKILLLDWLLDIYLGESKRMDGFQRFLMRFSVDLKKRGQIPPPVGNRVKMHLVCLCQPPAPPASDLPG